jgi:hypothetical protein
MPRHHAFERDPPLATLLISDSYIEEEIGRVGLPGQIAEVIGWISPASRLEVGDKSQPSCPLVPHHVVAMQVAMEEHGLAWERQNAVDPIAPSGH